MTTVCGCADPGCAVNGCAIARRLRERIQQPQESAIDWYSKLIPPSPLKPYPGQTVELKPLTEVDVRRIVRDELEKWFVERLS